MQRCDQSGGRNAGPAAKRARLIFERARRAGVQDIEVCEQRMFDLNGKLLPSVDSCWKPLKGRRCKVMAMSIDSHPSVGQLSNTSCM